MNTPPVSNAIAPHLFLHVLLDKDDQWHGFLIESDAPDGSVAACQTLTALAKDTPPGNTLTWYFDGPVELPPPDGLKAALIAGRSTPPDSTAYKQAQPLWQGQGALFGSVLVGAPKPSPDTPPDFHLIQTSLARTLPPYTLIGITSQRPVIAIDVSSDADRDWLRKNGCTVTSSEFLYGRGQGVRKPDMTRLQLLKLLGLLAEDAQTADIEAVFRAEPKLAYSLLRLVNSAACAPRSPITSFSQAINILGRRQLQRWLQLLVYADPNDGHRPNPLLQMAALRGRLMELLVTRQPSETLEALGETPADMAFMVGSFSLLDVLLGMPMTEVLAQLPLPAPVRTALLDQKGLLGEGLRAVEAASSRSYGVASHHLNAMGLSGEDYLVLQLDALTWAASLSTLA